VTVSGWHAGSGRATSRPKSFHASSIVVSREHRRAKTDRLDTDLLKRSFLGWLRGERYHCKTVEIPTIEDEVAKIAVVDAVIPPLEGDALVVESDQATVGDGHAGGCNATDTPALPRALNGRFASTTRSALRSGAPAPTLLCRWRVPALPPLTAFSAPSLCGIEGQLELPSNDSDIRSPLVYI